jgi:hypothetical protein
MEDATLLTVEADHHLAYPYAVVLALTAGRLHCEDGKR